MGLMKERENEKGGSWGVIDVVADEAKYRKEENIGRWLKLGTGATRCDLDR
uniref:Uncharacterized protein n=1 Tax=Cucumis melo TaxID=3656 RepID=A0A9I9CRU6_CUCME